MTDWTVSTFDPEAMDDFASRLGTAITSYSENIALLKEEVEGLENSVQVKDIGLIDTILTAYNSVHEKLETSVEDLSTVKQQCIDQAGAYSSAMTNANNRFNIN